jgi:hypothetical protein
MHSEAGAHMNGPASPESESGPSTDSVALPPPPPPTEGLRLVLWRLGGLLLTMRPHQWIKNVFVLAPMVFAREMFVTDLLVRAIGAFGVFCLLAGAVYLSDAKTAPKLGLDLEGGTQIILEPKTNAGQTVSTEQLNQARDIIVQRVDAGGVSGAEVTTQGDRNIVVSIPEIPTQEVRDAISKSSQLQFRPVLAVAAGSPQPTASPSPMVKDTSRSSTVARSGSSVTGCSGSRTDDSVSRTSVMRSALTDARGSRTSMKVAIMIDMRICIR